ncbi:hypothetical protein C2845_PM03G33020 [Panicum miliaceum]|uniref:Uncharacterized protein n=1 Tax=Panicum miliaceum TaxID=4540 RepID=A0A3L6T8R0_PANMI|nr:hypothetical protein C2845_PM03G33020 [Panicum miliaceum]
MGMRTKGPGDILPEDAKEDCRRPWEEEKQRGPWRAIPAGESHQDRSGRRVEGIDLPGEGSSPACRGEAASREGHGAMVPR